MRDVSVVMLGISLLLGGPAAAWGQLGGALLGPAGTRAYAMARAAEDTADAARAEGERVVTALQDLAAAATDP
ncbi:MAG: hypothetical protein ACREMB_25510, partial [Candidatus Rokuibacteriota bacterium]